MNETGKTLAALFILGLAGVGAYSCGKWVMGQLEKAGDRTAGVVKKQSPVKPDNLAARRQPAPGVEESPAAAEKYTFFETLNDSSMTKIAGLEGGILSRAEVAGAPPAPRPEPRQVVKVSLPAVREAGEMAHAAASKPPSPPAEPAPATALEARPEPSEEPLYAVQVSSFKDSQRARVLEDRLREMGYEAFQLAAGPSGDVRHRVYLGKYNDRKSADNAARKVRLEESIGGMVITLGR